MALMCHGLLDGKKSSHRSLIFLFLSHGIAIF